MSKFNKTIKSLERAELEALAIAYSDYVINGCETGQEPVCIAEYYDYEWQEFDKPMYMKGE